jgi:hypothetical protein
MLAMFKTDSAVLRDLARVVRRYDLEGWDFAFWVDELQHSYDRDAPAPVRHVAAIIRWRKPFIAPSTVAKMLRAKAREIERLAS